MSDEFNTNGAKATLKFLNKAYHGFVAAAPTNSAGILALQNSHFADTRDLKVTIGAPAGKVYCYAYPSRLGDLRSAIRTVPNKIRGVVQTSSDFAGYALSKVSFTNASGFTENYAVITLDGPVPDNNGTKLEFA